MCEKVTTFLSVLPESHVQVSAASQCRLQFLEYWHMNKPPLPYQSVIYLSSFLFED
jgi:hypothetical protein